VLIDEKQVQLCCTNAVFNINLPVGIIILGIQFECVDVDAALAMQTNISP